MKFNIKNYTIFSMLLLTLHASECSLNRPTDNYQNYFKFNLDLEKYVSSLIDDVTITPPIHKNFIDNADQALRAAFIHHLALKTQEAQLELVQTNEIDSSQHHIKPELLYINTSPGTSLESGKTTNESRSNSESNDSIYLLDNTESHAQDNLTIEYKKKKKKKISTATTSTPAAITPVKTAAILQKEAEDLRREKQRQEQILKNQVALAQAQALENAKKLAQEEKRQRQLQQNQLKKAQETAKKEAQIVALQKEEEALQIEAYQLSALRYQERKIAADQNPESNNILNLDEYNTTTDTLMAAQVPLDSITQIINAMDKERSILFDMELRSEGKNFHVDEKFYIDAFNTFYARTISDAILVEYKSMREHNDTTIVNLVYQLFMASLKHSEPATVAMVKLLQKAHMAELDYINILKFKNLPFDAREKDAEKMSTMLNSMMAIRSSRNLTNNI